MNFHRLVDSINKLAVRQHSVAALASCLLILLIACQPCLAKSVKYATFSNRQTSTVDTQIRTSSSASRLNDIVVYNQKTAKFHTLGCMAALRCTVNCTNLTRERAHQLGAIPCGLCHGGEFAPAESTLQFKEVGFASGHNAAANPRIARPKYGVTASTGNEKDEIVFNVKTSKFHSPTCSAAIRCTASCITLTRGEAHQRNGIPCGICNGGEL